jgi:tetratricopeptide (TPR) repeat protein
LGNVFRTSGRPAMAEAPYLKSIELRTRLVKDFPKETAYQSGLAEAHLMIGAVYEETGRPSPAELSYEKARSLLEPLARNQPEVVAFPSTLGKVYFHLAHLAHKRGNHKEVIGLSARGIATVDPLLKKMSGDAGLRLLLRSLYALRAMSLKESGRSLEALGDLLEFYALDKPAPK